jgi:hypothetical protein
MVYIQIVYYRLDVKLTRWSCHYVSLKTAYLCGSSLCMCTLLLRYHIIHKFKLHLKTQLYHRLHFHKDTIQLHLINYIKHEAFCSHTNENTTRTPSLTLRMEKYGSGAYLPSAFLLLRHCNLFYVSYAIT